jgi:TATA-box binding protein (TBP) (component of TFIID and TFIIIB)
MIKTNVCLYYFPEQLPGVIYYSKVAAEVAKIVFRGQKMNPP